MQNAKKKINWGPATGLIVLHLFAILAIFTFNWPAFWLAIALYWIATGLGICLGYHRLLTHRSFKCPKFVEYALTFFGTLSSQGGAINWVATHRYHHTKSDIPGDPHSPRDGFLWSHMLWFLKHSPIWDSHDFRVRYAPEMIRDRVHQFLNRYEWAFPWILGFALYFWGGWPFVIWGIFLRTVVTLHITWFTNSASHKWGYRSFPTTDDSRNLWWVALLGFGEGWHNNHHAFQYSARHGLRWWEIDLTYLTIRVLTFLKLASAIRLPNLALARARASNSLAAVGSTPERSEEGSFSDFLR